MNDFLANAHRSSGVFNMRKSPRVRCVLRNVRKSLKPKLNLFFNLF